MNQGSRETKAEQVASHESENNNNNVQDENIPEDMKEKIKIGQEINNNRPKESKGQRSSEKRHINNHSLGITNSGAKSIQIHTSQIQRLNKGQTNNFVSSPISGGNNNSRGTQKNLSEMFSQTSKFKRGEDLQ